MDIELPEPLTRHRGSPLLVTQLGLLGGRTVLLTDGPALYVHDTGGLLGSERTHRLDPFPLGHDDLAFTAGSTRVGGTLRINGLGELEIDHDQVGAVAQGLPVEAHRITPLPVSVTVRFRPTTDQLITAARKLPKHRARALGEHIAKGELYAHVEVHDGTLTLRRRGEVLCACPTGGWVASRSGRTVRVPADVMVCGQAARGLDIHLPLPEQAARLEAALRAGGSAVVLEAAHAVDAVQLRWGATAAVRADAALHDERLVLHAGEKELRFVFADPALRVAGDDHTLVLVDRHQGPVSLTGPFVARLAGDPQLQQAATRTLTSSTIPCRLGDETPATVSLHPGGISVRTADGEQPIGGAAWKPPLVERPPGGVLRCRLAHGTGTIELRGPHDALAAVFRHVQEVRLTPKLATSAEAARRRIVAQEGRYLLYTALGPLVELHALLREAHAAPGTALDLEAPLPLPEQDEALLALATELLQGAAELERHLERVAYRLPAFLTHCDAEVGSPGEKSPIALKLLEARTRAALSGLRPLAGKLAAVHEPLRNALAAAGIDTEPDYSVAALTTLAGAVINPIFLISGASQALAATNQAERLGSDRTGNARRAAVRSVERWNHLVTALVAPVAQQVLDGLFPVRWEVARALQGVPTERLAERLARLDTFLAFPPSATVAHSRGEVAGHLQRQIHRLAEGDGFIPF